MSIRKIWLDLEDYIDMLETRKMEVAADFNWEIPDGVWGHFLQRLKDHGLQGDRRPNHVVDNIAVNGNYGPAENYGLLDAMVRSIIKDAADEDITLDEAAAKDQLMDISFEGRCEIAKDADDGTALFFYEEPRSEYGLGVCYRLLPA